MSARYSDSHVAFARPRHRGVAAMEADLVYYRRRAAEERTAAAAAPSRRVRAVHLDLAVRYDARVASLTAEQRRSEIHLVSAA